MVPNASKTEIIGWMGDALKIKVQATPEGGRANVALVKLLSQTLGCSRSQIVIQTGKTSRNKLITIKGMTAKSVKNCLPRESRID